MSDLRQIRKKVMNELLCPTGIVKVQLLRKMHIL